MLEGIRFLFSFCWRTNKKYVLVLLAWKITEAILPLINIAIPKFIIDELIGAKSIQRLMYYTGALIFVNFVGTLLSRFLTSQSLVQRVKCYDSFQIDISRKMMLADYENLETPEFFDAREKAFKFLYGEGWGFATVLDRTAGIIGKVGTFIGVITIMSVLSPVVVILFIIIIVINGLLESRTKRQLIQWDMERTPLERRTAYMGDLISDYTSGKEIRLYSMRE